MSKITTEQIQKLRATTGAGMMDCKKLLTEAGGDLDKAVVLFRKQGKKIVDKKAGRKTGQGIVDSYIHAGNKVGVLIEVNCETDFVALNDDFKALVHDLAMHIAAFDPKYIEPEEVTAAELDNEKEVYTEQLKKEGKPEDVMAKIIEGKLKKYYEEVCLMEQKFLKDDKKTVREYISEAVAKIGENIKVSRFIRYSL